MDVPPGNTLPNPYSDNAAASGQPAFPWRGRITCSPAAGFAGTADKSATAASQVATLFGAATPASFSVTGQSVSWTGTPGDWGLRRMVLHYAHLCAAAGGVGALVSDFYSGPTSRFDLGNALVVDLLTAGDTVELQGYFRVADGYFAADHTSFWGCKVG
jgi:hypothetical protein